MQKYTASGLIKALEDGLLLEKDFFNEDPRQYEKNECIQFCFLSKRTNELSVVKTNIELKGWGSALNGVKDTIFNDIVLTPEKWSISKFSIEDRPWIKKSEKILN
jgi:hypothetical protein